MISHVSRLTLRFGEFECDGGAYALRRNGRRVRLARQPMDLLFLLLERRGELVSREEIAKHLWSKDVFVDVDAGIRTAILKIRRALSDSHASSRFVETIPGKGYRFVGDVAVVHATAGAQPIVAKTATKRLRLDNLPADLTSFVGREEALAELHRLATTARLLSLTGSGGVGKTRLAIRVASQLIPDYPDGVWLVDLAPLASPSLIPQTIATIFGVRESPERSVRDALADYLRERQLLLILDTCEHLIDGCAGLAEMLLQAAPELRIIATSREALRVPGETVYRVPSLTSPGPSEPCLALADFEATTLFVDRAKAALPAFDPSAHAAAVFDICRRLGGIPLAIELAAAQVASLSPRHIEARLTCGSWTTGTRTAVTRQRTLDATVQWSYQLLTEKERLLFDRLSVFPASCTLAAAERVCGGDGIEPDEVLDLLSRLASKSLVNVEASLLDERRYHLLETIRAYARQRLSESGGPELFRERHFEFFYAAFKDASQTLSGPDQVHCLRRLHVEQDNIRTALDCGLSSPALADRAIELAGGLFWYWTKRGLFTEGRQWLERAAQVPTRRRLRAHLAVGLGHMAYFQGRVADMAAHNDEVLALGREEDDPWLISTALFGHALARFESGEFKEAAAFAQAALDATGGRVGSPLLVLGNVALVNDEPDRALALFEQAIANLRGVGDIWGLGIVLSLAAGLRAVRGNFSEAHAYASEAILLYRELEDPRGIAWSLEVFAGLRSAEGRVEDAARLWGAADGLLQSVGGALVPTIAWIRDRYLPVALAAMGEAAFDNARAEGRVMRAEQAITFVGVHGA